MVKNVVVETEKKIGKSGSATIKRNPTSQEIHGHAWGKPSIKITGLGGSFKHGDKKYMAVETLKEYALASAEEACEYPGQ